MLDHIPCEGDREVIPEAFLGRKGRLFTGILDAEQELVALVAVLAQQGGEILHRRRLDLLVSVGAENAPDGVEDIVAFGHFALAEVTGSLGNGRFLCHSLSECDCKYTDFYLYL